MVFLREVNSRVLDDDEGRENRTVRTGCINVLGRYCALHPSCGPSRKADHASNVGKSRKFAVKFL